MTYIDPRGKVFAHLDRVTAWSRGETPAPVTVEWDLSNRCVLGCQDCHFAHTHVKGPWASRARTLPMAFDSTGDMADLDLVAAALPQMAEAGVRGVIWSGGGEPTTHPHWTEIMLLAARTGLEQGMYTLGGLLTPGSAYLLAATAKWVVVSLDCADGATYAAEKGVPAERFTAACDGIRWLANYRRVNGPDTAVVGVSFLLHRENYMRAWDMLALARSLGATYATFRPAIRVAPDTPSQCADDRGWIQNARRLFEGLALQPDVEIEPARFLAYADWAGRAGHGYTACKGIRLNTTITPDGRVWVCPQRRGVAGSCLGDLRTEAFADLWARHPGHYTVDAGCRVMCRLHPVNETIAALEAPHVHEAFV